MFYLIINDFFIHFKCSTKEAAEVIDISVSVFSLWLLVIHDPGLAVHDVLVQELFACFDVQGDEPLVGEGIEVHVVADLPIVEGATDLYLPVSWASVVELEDLRLLAEGGFVEG